MARSISYALLHMIFKRNSVIYISRISLICSNLIAWCFHLVASNLIILKTNWKWDLNFAQQEAKEKKTFTQYCISSKLINYTYEVKIFFILVALYKRWPSSISFHLKVTPTYQTMSDWLVSLHHQGAYSHLFPRWKSTK